MKKFLIAALSVMVIFAFMGCKDDEEGGGNNSTTPTVTKYTVSFDLDGGKLGDATTITAVQVEKGKTLGTDFPGNPTKDKNEFKGWFDGTTEYKSTTAINKNVTLKAKWEVLVECECTDCAVKDKNAKDATDAGLLCTCTAGDPATECAENCAVCKDVKAAPYAKLLSTKKSIDRTLGAGKTLVYGGANSGAIMGDIELMGAMTGAKVGTAADAYIWGTNSLGSGANAIVLLAPGKITLSDPKKIYRLNYVGRFSQATAPQDGRVECKQVDEGDVDATGGTGITASPYGNNVTVSATGFNVDIILSDKIAATGVKTFANQWGAAPNNDPTKFVLSVDDVIVYTTDAPVITDFEIELTAPKGGVKAETTINSTQFTGSVQWSPALEAGDLFKKDVEYTPSITIKAKPGYQIEDLDTDQAFVLNPGDDEIDSVSYNKVSKVIVFGKFPPAALAPPPVTADLTTAVAVGSAELTDVTAASYKVLFTESWGKGFVALKVTIPDGFTLADFTSITCDAVNETNCYGKETRIFGSPNATDTPDDLEAVLSDDALIIGGNYQLNGGAKGSFTFTVPKTAAAKAYTGDVWLGFYVNTFNGGGENIKTPFEVSNFKLVP